MLQSLGVIGSHSPHDNAARVFKPDVVTATCDITRKGLQQRCSEVSVCVDKGRRTGLTYSRR